MSDNISSSRMAFVPVDLHPTYNERQVGGWRDVLGFDEKHYQVNHLGKLRNKDTGKILKSFSRVLHIDGKPISVRRSHLVLNAFYPREIYFVREENDETEYCVDHIDEDSSNHHVNNLQHSTKRVNSIKSNNLRPRIKLLTIRQVCRLDGPNGKEVVDYLSLKDAAEKMCFTVEQVSRMCRTGKPSRGVYFKYKFQPDLPGEIWEPMNKGYQMAMVIRESGMPPPKNTAISNRGRYRRGDGFIWEGTAQKPFREVTVNYCKFYVHQLVYAAFHNKMPPSKDTKDENGNTLLVLHNDRAPTVTINGKPGYYRNYAEDLRMGTNSENRIEYYEVKRTKHPGELLYTSEEVSHTDKRRKIA